MADEELEAGAEQAGNGNGEAQSEVYKLGDEEVPVEKLSEAWKAYGNDTKWQARNTQRAQELSEMERRLEKSRQLEEWLGRNPDKYEAVKAIFSQVNPDPKAAALGQQVPVEIEQARREVGAMVEEIRVAREMDSLKAKHPKFFGQAGFEGKLIDYCIENKVGNLEHAFKLMTYDERATEALKEGQQMVQAAKEKSRTLASPKGSGGAAKPGDRLKGIRGFGPDFQRAVAEGLDDFDDK